MLKIGDKAPLFELSDQNGQQFQLEDYLGKKNLVIYFYPKNETPGCTIEACTFRDSYEDFVDAGAEVIGISRDSVKSHQDFASRRELPFILLSDPKEKVHKQFGLKSSFLGLLSPRVTFVVDKEGVIQHAFDSQLLVRQHVQESLELIKTL